MMITKDDVLRLRSWADNDKNKKLLPVVCEAMTVLLDEIEQMQIEVGRLNTKISNALDYESRLCKQIDSYQRIENNLRGRIAELEAENRWIPVSERLPDGDGFYEVTIKENDTTYTNKHYFHASIGWDLYYGKVTHWRRQRPASPSIKSG